VPDLPPHVSFTDRASCPQQVPLVMMRPVVVSTAQSVHDITFSFVCYLAFKGKGKGKRGFV